MKIWFLADTHLGMKGDNDDVLNDCYNYYNDVLIPYMKKNVKEDDILVHLGDVFDNRSNIGIHTLYCVINLFEQFSNIFSDIRVCVGNHDMWEKSSTEITALHAIKYIKNVKIYFNPTIDNIFDKKILFMPWIEDLSEQREWIKNSNIDYVFGHLEIGGCLTNSRKGIKLKTTNGVESSDFKKAQVFAGHIHIRQDYKNIHYVGNPYHKDRGDIDNVKGIIVLDLETGKTEFIENTFSPMYIKENINDILDDTILDLKKRWKNNYVDLIIKTKDYTNCNTESLRELLRGYYKEFNPMSDNSETVIEVNDSNVDVGNAKSSEDMLNEYVDICDIDDNMKDEIKNYFKEFRNKI